VTRVLGAIIAERGMAGAIRCDNGPEFTGPAFSQIPAVIEICRIPLSPTGSSGAPRI
jgi:hypothetical protein